MDPKTKFYSPSYVKTRENDKRIIAALAAAENGMTAGELGTLMGYSDPTRVHKPIEDLNWRLAEQRSPHRVRKYPAKRILGIRDKTIYKLEARVKIA